MIGGWELGAMLSGLLEERPGVPSLFCPEADSSRRQLGRVFLDPQAQSHRSSEVVFTGSSAPCAALVNAPKMHRLVPQLSLKVMLLNGSSLSLHVLPDCPVGAFLLHGVGILPTSCQTRCSQAVLSFTCRLSCRKVLVSFLLRISWLWPDS